MGRGVGGTGTQAHSREGHVKNRQIWKKCLHKQVMPVSAGRGRKDPLPGTKERLGALLTPRFQIYSLAGKNNYLL